MSVFRDRRGGTEAVSGNSYYDYAWIVISRCGVWGYTSVDFSQHQYFTTSSIPYIVYTAHTRELTATRHEYTRWFMGHPEG